MLFPLKQRLLERASMLHYTYIASLVKEKFISYRNDMSLSSFISSFLLQSFNWRYPWEFCDNL
jgi:hypothetical protein